MNRLKAIYRSWAIPCAGQQVYSPRHRAAWLEKLREAGVRRRAEQTYQQFDFLMEIRKETRKELLAESRKHPARMLLEQIPRLGPIRVHGLGRDRFYGTSQRRLPRYGHDAYASPNC
jgi:hypothetical protein